MKESCTSKITGCHAEIKSNQIIFLRKCHIFSKSVCLCTSKLLMLWSGSGGEWQKLFHSLFWIWIPLFSHLKDKKCPMIFIIIDFLPKFCKIPIWITYSFLQHTRLYKLFLRTAFFDVGILMSLCPLTNPQYLHFTTVNKDTEDPYCHSQTPLKHCTVLSRALKWCIYSIS